MRQALRSGKVDPAGRRSDRQRSAGWPAARRRSAGLRSARRRPALLVCVQLVGALLASSQASRRRSAGTSFGVCKRRDIATGL